MNREQMQAILGFLPSDEQWAAITAPLNAPMLVLAGAGSGKTAVMSARIVWAVSTGRIAPEQVLGLTFTHKAAGELATRTRTYLDALHLSEDTGDPAISTFHAFAVDLIAEFGLLAGAEPSATLLSPTDLAQATFRSVVGSRVPCEDFGTGHIDTVRQRVQSLDEQLSEHLCAPEDLRKFDRRLIEDLATQSGADAQKTVLASRRRILASQVVEEVRADRAASAQVGFADLMRLAALISRMPLVSAQLRERYRMVLVDEYQDTSVAQADVLASLFGSGHPLTAVGDPLQAIYGWRGASVANIDGFPQAFGARVRPLTVNRRSGERILDAANAVATPVRAQHPGVEVLRPGGDDVGQAVAGMFATFAEETAWLLEQIHGQLDGGRPPEEIAVLCRTNKDVAEIAAAMRAAGIPTAAAALGSVLHMPEVVEVLSVLRVLQTGDNAALVRLLTGPQWRIGTEDLAALGSRARGFLDAGRNEPGTFDERVQEAVTGVDPVEVVTLLEAVYDPGPAVSEDARARLAELAAQLDAIRPALAAGVEEAAHRTVEVTGLGVEVRLGPLAVSRMDGLAALFDLIGMYRTGHDDPSVGAFLHWLDFARQLDETPDTDLPIRGGAVQVMSVHRAKGLEWDCVFVPCLSAGIFPSSQGRNLWTTNYKELPYPLRGDRSRLPHLPDWTLRGYKAAMSDLKRQYAEQDAFEENRLAYVALTRAREFLATTGHWYSAQGKQRPPSPYLLAVRDVAGVEIVEWLEECPEPPVPTDSSDVDWPAAIYTDVSPPPAAADPLTLEESARLAALDADIEAVYARECAQSRPVTEVDLPAALSASLLMRVAKDPQAAAEDLVRPMPRITPAAARRGTAFHEWVAASHQQLSLLPEWDAAADADIAGDDELAAFIAGYQKTPYAQLVPYAVETEVAVPVAGAVVRGVIDAVYEHDDGTWEVVDWKTNREQTADPLQLAVYRAGWAAQMGVDPADVRAAFVYVRDGEVVRPELPELDELVSQAHSLPIGEHSGHR
ncbi:MAG: ATP-dependent DNA helicase [Candidatus Nanopelagicales bacterium]